MEYTRLGASGLRVSRIALGCMSFGVPTERAPWALDEEHAEPFFRQALELGITFWDTANRYGNGSSEGIVGRALRKYARRDDIVLATELGLPMHSGPGGSGLSRKAIFEQIDTSLTRLGTDYVDLYQIHRFDPQTPVEETMAALHEVVTAGKVRYLGVSSMWAWQFATMQHAAHNGGWTRFVSMQDQYSVLHREEEREMFGLLRESGVGGIPWSPLAGGRATRPWGDRSTRRAGTDLDVDFDGRPVVLDSDKAIIDAIELIAEQRGISMAQVALAWVLTSDQVSTAPTTLYFSDATWTRSVDRAQVAS